MHFVIAVVLVLAAVTLLGWNDWPEDMYHGDR